MRLIAILLQSFVFCAAFSQLPLNFQSYAIKLSVSKDQRFVLTTKAGEVGTAVGLYNNWERIDPRSKELFGPTLEGSYFYNKDTGFVYGFIRNEKSNDYNFIYHTTNGGRNWKMIDFEQSGWIDDACALDNGEAWLSVAGSGIAYSSDYGFHWNKIDIPEKKQRFASIFSNAAHHGIIGSLWNLLAYTSDNGKNWKYLPTPLDQKKYNKTNKDSRPEFSKVALFGNRILAKQENLVFYTGIDSTNWIPLPGYVDFFTDGDNTALFFKTTKNKFIRSDSAFHVLGALESEFRAYDARCKNGNLFILTTSGIVQLKPDNNIINASFRTAGSESINPYSFGFVPNGFLVVKDNKVSLQKDYNGSWTYQFTFPFNVENKGLSVWNNSVLYQKDDSLFYFSLSGKLIRSVAKGQMVQDFCKAEINQISFSRGSSGCFHSFRDVLTYSKKPDGFGSPIEQNVGGKHSEQLPEAEDEISVTAVNDFLKEMPAFFQSYQMSSIEDLGFTENDYQQCKKDILAFKQSLEDPGKAPKKKNNNGKTTAFHFAENNLDFDRLLNLVDSIKHIDAGRLNSILGSLSEVWSTTTNSTSFTLVNNKGEELSFSSNYFEPNPYYFPWTVSLNGCITFSTSMTINNFIREIYPNLLDEKNKVAVLHTIVKRLY